MGEVLLAALRREAGFEKRVALKRTLPALARDPSFLARFEAEARNAALLTHRHIVQVFDFGRHEGAAWLAMEYVHGVDLKALLDRLGGAPMPAAYAVELGVACAQALHYAHRALDPKGRSLGLVHRDVSPQNVLLSFEGDIKLADFGLALIAEEAARAPGAIVGKYGYMSPEQAAGRPVDARSDAFSLGVVLYEALSGRRCFAADDGPLATLDRVLSARPLVAPEDLGLHPALARFLSEALACAPADRPEDLEALGAALRGAADEAGVRLSDRALGPWLAAQFPERAARASVDGRIEGAAAPAWEATIAAAQPIAAQAAPPVAEAPPPVTPAALPARARRIRVGVAAGLIAAAGIIVALVWAPRGPEAPAPTDVRSSASASVAASVEPSSPPVRFALAVPSAAPSLSPSLAPSLAPRRPHAVSPPPGPATTPPSRVADPSSAAPSAAVAASESAPVSTPPASSPPLGPTVRVSAEGARVRTASGDALTGAEPLGATPLLVNIIGGEGPPVSMRLSRKGEGVRANIAARPWGAVTWDGRAVGETPIADLPVRAGAHTLSVVGPDGRATVVTLTLDPGAAL